MICPIKKKSCLMGTLYEKDPQLKCLDKYAQVMLIQTVTINRLNNMQYHLFRHLFRLVDCQLALNDITQRK